MAHDLQRRATVGSEQRIAAEVESYLANEYFSVLVASQLLRTAPLQDLLEDFEAVLHRLCDAEGCY